MSEYLEDTNLNFLNTVQPSKLKQLENILLYSNDGTQRFATNSDTIEKLYRTENSDKWKILMTEFQTFGGNGLRNLTRGSGVLYAEILDDVADKMELTNYLKGKNVVQKEDSIISEMIQYLNENIKKKLKTQQQNSPFETTTKIRSKLELATVLRTDYDSSHSMENLLCDIGSSRKNPFAKVGNFLRNYTPLAMTKMFNVNWSVMVQGLLQISMLRSSTEGLSISIIGMMGSGKTTFLKLLQKGEFEIIDRGTSDIDSYPGFYSKFLETDIAGGKDFAGAPDYVKKQNDWSLNKDFIFFFFNPMEILSNENVKDDFMGRICALNMLGVNSEKLYFFATHADEYNDNTIREFWRAIERVNSISSAISRKNCSFVNLKDVLATKETVKQIIAKN